MPLQQGEVALLTLFADIHYYFTPPSAKPVHHRFDKRSYVYLYHDAINKRGRIEVANHAGTPDQDAFQGFLDRSHVEYSQKQPNLFTISVDSLRQPNGTASAQDTSQWHLPAEDLRHEGKYMYKLNTIDLYFWTAEDGTMFLDSLKRCLQPQQIRSLDGPAVHAEHRDSMSPVVQQLERAAITPAQQVNRNDSVSTAQSSTAPIARHTPVNPVTLSPAPVGHQAVEAPGGFAPMAYNPAAPAAPEPIAHREKTPPPIDAAGGTGLQYAAVHEHGTAGFAPQPGTLQHQTSFGAQQQPGYFSGPPQQSLPGPPQHLQRTNTSGSFPPPPPQQQSPHQPSVGTSGSQQAPQYAQSFSPPPQQQQQQQQQQQHQHQDPNAHLYAQQQPGLQRQSTLPQQYQQQYAQSHTPQPPLASPPPHQQSFSPQPAQQYAQYQQPPQASPGFQSPPSQPQAQPTYQIGQPSTPGYGQPMPSPGFAPAPQQPQQQPQVPVGGYSGYNYQQQAGQQPAEAYNVHQQVYRPTEAEAAHGHGKLQAGQPAPNPQDQQPGKMNQRLDKYEKGVSKFLKRLDKKF